MEIQSTSMSFQAKLNLSGNLKGLTEEEIFKLTQRAKKIGSSNDTIDIFVGKFETFENKEYLKAIIKSDYVGGSLGYSKRDISAKANIQGNGIEEQLGYYLEDTPNYLPLEKPFKIIIDFLKGLKLKFPTYIMPPKKALEYMLENKSTVAEKLGNHFFGKEKELPQETVKYLDCADTVVLACNKRELDHLDTTLREIGLYGWFPSIEDVARNLIAKAHWKFPKEYIKTMEDSVAKKELLSKEDSIIRKIETEYI